MNFDEAASAQVRGWWASFAKSGNPDPAAAADGNISSTTTGNRAARSKGGDKAKEDSASMGSRAQSELGGWPPYNPAAPVEMLIADGR